VRTLNININCIKSNDVPQAEYQQNYLGNRWEAYK
jgi:hypothetical protein